ncbi:MAG: hypothetical protein CMJ75_22775 [Planctomycetaceae bacterium]|nr:hypothetical protein [Planctomycetaceae bacterium]
MATTAPSLDLAPHVRSLLAGLRWRIRCYVWLEGVALCLAWLGFTFWFGLAVDFLPVLVGASELPRVARATLLIATGLVASWLFYRWVLRRVFVQLGDRSMAVLLERRFTFLGDSLVTSVEMSNEPERAIDFNPDMLTQTHHQAIHQIQEVQLRRVFRFPPLLWKLSIAAAAILSISVFYAINLPAFEICVRRMYLLENQPWPRRAYLEMDRIEVVSDDSTDQMQTSRFLNFDKRRSVKVARGTNLRLYVNAGMNARVVPDYCTIQYETADRDRGRVNMSQMGRPLNGFQPYAFDGKPLRGILSNMRFDVIGFDYRIRDYRIQVVDRPEIQSVRLDCRFPEYIERLPETGVPWTPGMQRARGSTVTLHFTTTKRLREVTLNWISNGAANTANERSLPIGSDGRSFVFPSGVLDADLVFELTLRDTDNIYNDHPVRFVLAAVDDEAPRVDAQLHGIGSAITPQARIPFQGTADDDYGIARSTVELTLQRPPGPEGTSFEQLHHSYPFDLSDTRNIDTELDFRTLDQEKQVSLLPGDKLELKVTAQDRSTLPGAPHLGESDAFQVDVVSDDELLKRLEHQELALRQRFELILGEMTDLRDNLIRLHDDLTAAENKTSPDSTTSPASENATVDDELSPQDRARAFRLLRIQQAQIQSRKSTQETLGVAISFEDILLQLLHNRIPKAEERKSRIKNRIAEPLREISTVDFPKFDASLEQLESLQDETTRAASAASDTVVQANAIVSRLESVLQEMVELETYNELIDLVRKLINDQAELSKETDKERKRRLLGPLLKRK